MIFMGKKAHLSSSMTTIVPISIKLAKKLATNNKTSNLVVGPLILISYVLLQPLAKTFIFWGSVYRHQGGLKRLTEQQVNGPFKL